MIFQRKDFSRSQNGKAMQRYKMKGNYRPYTEKMKGKKPYRAHAMNTDCTYQYEHWFGNRTQLSICYIILNYYKIY